MSISFGAVNDLGYKLLRSAVVIQNVKHFEHYPTAAVAFKMDDIIDGLSDLCFDIRKQRLRMAAKHEIGEPAQRLRCGVRMNGCERTSMTRIERIQQRSCLGAPHLAKDDPVRSEPQSVFKQFVERYRCLKRV